MESRESREQLPDGKNFFARKKRRRIRRTLRRSSEPPARFLQNVAVLYRGVVCFLANPIRGQTKKQKTRPFLTGALLLSATFVSSAVPRASAQAAGYASGVVDYTAGTGISATYTNVGSALGKPGGNVGSKKDLAENDGQ